MTTRPRSFIGLMLALVSLMLAVLLAASFALSVNHAREFLGRQLGVHAQDTATALALTLAPALQRGDRVEIASLIKAVADGGYFQRIRVAAASGEMLAERVVKIDVAGVPDWFVKELKLETPMRSALIMDGWREGGRVEVSSHPGYAYQQLWSDAGAMLIWYGAAGSIGFVLLAGLVRSALRPLRAMEQQAQAIASGRFSKLAPLPWARELRLVANAMNRMADKVDGMLTDKVETIEKLEVAAHRDSLTGLYTRDFLTTQVALLMREPESCERVALLLIRLSYLADVNTRWGYDEGNVLLKQFATLLRDEAQALQGAVAARAGGAEFMLLIRETTPDEALSFGHALLARLREFVSPRGASASAIHIGIGFRDVSLTDISKLFAQADMALRSAESRGRFWVFIYRPDEISHDVTYGATHWRMTIEHALAQGELVLYEQAVRHATTGHPLYYELLARIRDESGRLISAGAFMPMAHRLGLATAIDRAMVELVLRQSFQDEVPRVLNLSLDSITDLVFTTWLQQRLREQPGDLSRILFEFPERVAAEAPESVSSLVIRLDALGVRFGFDHVGTTPDALARIRHMRPQFLKCDETLIAGIDTGPRMHSLIEMLRELAHALDSVFIASGIETNVHVEFCRAMGAGALQGRVLGAPCPVRVT